MISGGEDIEEVPIGELVGRLIDDGKAYAKAELELAKIRVETKASAAKKPILLGAAALLFLIAGVVVLCMTLALALAILVGPLAGGLIATFIIFATSVGLGYWAKSEWEKSK